MAKREVLGTLVFVREVLDLKNLLAAIWKLRGALVLHECQNSVIHLEQLICQKRGRTEELVPFRAI